MEGRTAEVQVLARDPEQVGEVVRVQPGEVSKCVSRCVSRSAAMEVGGEDGVRMVRACLDLNGSKMTKGGGVGEEVAWVGSVVGADMGSWEGTAGSLCP